MYNIIWQISVQFIIPEQTEELVEQAILEPLVMHQVYQTSNATIF